MMEDINMVMLNLMISIAYYRITSGHELTTPCTYSCPDHDVIEDEFPFRFALPQIKLLFFSLLNGRRFIFIYIAVEH